MATTEMPERFWLGAAALSAIVGALCYWLGSMANAPRVEYVTRIVPAAPLSTQQPEHSDSGTLGQTSPTVDQGNPVRGTNPVGTVPSESKVLTSNTGSRGPWPGCKINKANSLQARSLGESAFIASSKSDFSFRVLKLFEAVPHLRAEHADYFEKVGENIARQRWKFLLGLDQDGNSPAHIDFMNGNLFRQASVLSALLSNSLGEDKEAIFGREQADQRIREWVEEAFRGNFFDRIDDPPQSTQREE
ncbi:MAG: hypothetical protein HYY93_14730 [Planctomycetes bacterium]|nr:hypothetical protein [Planctomycetota bacterium]